MDSNVTGTRKIAESASTGAPRQMTRRKSWVPLPTGKILPTVPPRSSRSPVGLTGLRLVDLPTAPPSPGWNSGVRMSDTRMPRNAPIVMPTRPKSYLTRVGTTPKEVPRLATKRA